MSRQFFDATEEIALPLVCSLAQISFQAHLVLRKEEKKKEKNLSSIEVLVFADWTCLQGELVASSCKVINLLRS